MKRPCHIIIKYSLTDPEFVPWLVEEMQANKTEDIKSDEIFKSNLQII